MAAREGSYEGMAPTRKLRIVFDNILPPTEVKVNGEVVPYSRFSKEGCWMYEGSELAATVMLTETSADEDVVVECTYPQDRTAIDGKKAVVRRMFALTPEAKLLFSGKVDAFMMLPKDLLKAAQCGSLINENPGKAAQYLLDIDVDGMYRSVASYEQLPEDFKAKVKAQGASVYEVLN